MTEESIFLENVGDNPRMRILQYLIGGRNFDSLLGFIPRSSATED